MSTHTTARVHSSGQNLFVVALRTTLRKKCILFPLNTFLGASWSVWPKQVIGFDAVAITFVERGKFRIASH